MERSGNPVKIMSPAELHTTGGFAAEITRLSPRLCHATRDDISIAGSPPTGEDDELGGGVSYGARVAAGRAMVSPACRTITCVFAVILAAPVSSFPPKADVTNKWSEAGIQLKYASGVAGHNRRLRRRNDADFVNINLLHFSHWFSVLVCPIYLVQVVIFVRSCFTLSASCSRRLMCATIFRQRSAGCAGNMDE